MNEICTMVNDPARFISDMKNYLGEDYKEKIFGIEFIDNEVPFVRFKTNMTCQELFDLSIYCGKEEIKRGLLNER